MVRINPHNELRAGNKLLELPSGEPEWWKWLLSVMVGSLATFTVILVLLARATSAFAVAVMAPVLFVFITVLVHTISERAR